jgi:hypothetical protein
MPSSIQARPIEERTQALELAKEIGPTEAARRMNIPLRTIMQWRSPKPTARRRRFDIELDGAIRAVMVDLAAPGADRRPLLDALDRLMALRDGAK